MFRERYLAFEEEFRDALAADDTAARRSAHSLKGAALNIAAPALHARTLALENACTGSMDDIDARLAAVLGELQGVLDDITTAEQYLDAAGTGKADSSHAA